MFAQEADHVARMARFALRCVTAATQTLVDEDDPSGGFVVIRAGFHSGPVVANVVGTKYRWNFSFSLNMYCFFTLQVDCCDFLPLH